MRSLRRGLPEPEVRVGHCCGCHAYPIVLYKLQGIYRYRCAECYESETGFWPHLAPPRSTSAKPT